MNKRFAIDLIAEDPIVVCSQRNVWSNSGGALGHPKVYINLVIYFITLINDHNIVIFFFCSKNTNLKAEYN